VTKIEQMLEMVLTNQVTIMRWMLTASDEPGSGRKSDHRKTMGTRAEVTENWLKYHPPKQIK